RAVSPPAAPRPVAGPPPPAGSAVGLSRSPRRRVPNPVVSAPSGSRRGSARRFPGRSGRFHAASGRAGSEPTAAPVIGDHGRQPGLQTSPLPPTIRGMIGPASGDVGGLGGLEPLATAKSGTVKPPAPPGAGRPVSALHAPAFAT